MYIMTSYFYQIRFFTPNMIPLSTAVWDPKWYHNFKDQDHIFIDLHGVINGLRVDQMHPNNTCRDLCRGLDRPTPSCTGNPSTCLFLTKYSEQLESIDGEIFFKDLEDIINKAVELTDSNEEPVGVFIVHEAPSKICSERTCIQNWVTSCGFPCSELSYPIL